MTLTSGSFSGLGEWSCKNIDGVAPLTHLGEHLELRMLSEMREGGTAYGLSPVGASVPGK